MIGAARANPNGNFSGSSYVIFSSSFATYTGTSGDDILTGTVPAARFVAGNGDDTMIGRGGADVFYGEEGNDTVQVADLNFQRVDGGTGIDGLALTGSNLDLDLTNIGGRISGIEMVGLTGDGNNTLTLTALDL